MYINLGTLRLQYTNETNDWMIIGEVLDSGMSFEKPRLVRSVDELNIWFGKEYKDYNYLVELLNTGVTLYLYKPVLPEKLKDTNYIDLSTYESIGNYNDSSLSFLESDIDWVESLKNSPETYYFYYNDEILGFSNNHLVVLSTSDIYNREKLEYRENININFLNSIIINNNNIFYMCGYSAQYIWFENKITAVSNLQQNIYLTTESSNNRDTLAITTDSSVKYLYPKFNVDSLDYSTSYPDFQIFPDGVINLELIDRGYQTYAFNYNESSTSSGDFYIIVYDVNRISNIICNTVPSSVDQKYYEEIYNSAENEFSNAMENLGYLRTEEHLISQIPVPVTYFYKLSEGNYLTPNINLTYELLAWKYRNYVSIEFWSKTIGRGSVLDDDDLIEVSIEEGSEDNYYQISITRYGYTEIYDGPLEGENRLDFIISRDSKLVYCNLVNIENGLQLGTYRLRGAVKEENTREGYLYALSKVFDDSGEPVYPDYFLIPDKYKYISQSISGDYNYYPEYEIFLEFAKQRGCQFLIENTPSYYKHIKPDIPPTDDKYALYYDGNCYKDYLGNVVSKEVVDITLAGGDFVFNYTRDRDNWLIYFYQDISYKGLQRPAYYVFLRGLLQDDYQVLEKDILYPDLTTDAYSEFPIEKLLETYKSNYLVCNNLIYYYKKYMDGEKYNTTGWMRFAASKIFREFEKNRWEYLGEKSLGKIELGITKILDKIVTNFSIIENINLTEFIPELQRNQINLGIDVYVNDLLKNNLKLNITLNYKEN